METGGSLGPTSLAGFQWSSLSSLVNMQSPSRESHQIHCSAAILTKLRAVNRNKDCGQVLHSGVGFLFSFLEDVSSLIREKKTKNQSVLTVFLALCIYAII